MCGIVGILSTESAADQAAAITTRMMQRLHHRGPDGHGMTSDGPIVLGHRRLKVIDLSDDASQPMADASGRYVIVYNGEIYNYLELRVLLSQMGFVFKTNSDTEVLLAAYTQWGSDCLRRFNGMFAFAIWDRQKKTLFCARDRLGVKPFYYYHDAQQFAFASEIKALMALPGFIPQARKDIVRDFLVLGAVEHRTETFFERIYKLPAAHWMMVDQAGPKIQRYWDLTVSDQLTDKTDAHGDLAQGLRHHLTEAVNLRLRSDVPVGTCLSGGIDSSAIVCLINKQLALEHPSCIGKYQKTFSSIATIPELDERPFIRDVLAHTQAAAHWVQPTADGFLQELDDILWHQEEPFVSPSIYAQWCVFHLAKQKGVTVVLDGQGADEQLCGYRKFSLFWFQELIRRHAYADFLRELCFAPLNWDYYRGADLRHGIKYLRNGSQPSFINLFKPGVLEFSKDNVATQNSLAARIHHDMVASSLPALLRYEDKNSMAFSIESRTPFLDVRLVEFLAGLPLNVKIARGWTKFVLRQAMAGIVPDSICWRRTKLGFDVPLADWLKGALRHPVSEAFSRGKILSQCFQPLSLMRAFHEFIRNRSLLPATFFFRAYILEKWATRFGIEAL